MRLYDIFGKNAKEIDKEIKSKKKTVQISLSRYKDKVSIIANNLIIAKDISKDDYDFLIRNWDSL